jgi:histidinol-phosphate aminotransferase
LHTHSEDHGGISPAELHRLGIDPHALVDFSVNSNPFGPAPAVLEALQKVDVSLYPDRDCDEIRRALGQACRVAPDQVCIGNGTAELIWLIAQAFLHPGDRVLILGPTFGEYARAAAALGAEVKEIRACAPRFAPPVEAFLAAIRQQQPRLVFLCNPNNPTGKFIPLSDIERVVQTCGKDCLLVLDEAYRSFVDGKFFSPLSAENCLVLRSMTKDFALAGLRLGYSLGTAAQIARLRQFQPAWNVNAYAQAAGLAALQSLDYYRKTLEELIELKRDFFFSLSNASLTVVSSDVHFGLIALNRPAVEVRRILLQQSIQVRDCASFGLPDFIRISTRQKWENEKFIEMILTIKSYT